MTPAQPFSRRERVFLVVLFLVALATRITYLIEIHNNPFFEHPRLDAQFHDVWGQAIASGDFIGKEVFFRAPLYPYFLGLLYFVFGHSYVIPRLVQHLLGAVTVVLLYALARRFLGRKTAAIASLLACFYAVLIYVEGELWFESLLTFLCVVWLVLFVRALENRSPSRWLAAGLVYGLICITRPTFLGVIIPLMLYVLFDFMHWRNWKQYVPLCALYFAGMLIPILPLTVRNEIVGHEFVLIASQGGINFFIGNNEHADGMSSSFPGQQGTAWENTDVSAAVAKVLGHSPTPSEASAFWYSQGLAFIASHPREAAGLWVKKAYLFWNKIEIPNNQSFYSFSRYSFLLRALPIGFWLVGTLGLFGVYLSWSQPGMRLISIFVLVYWMVTIAFFVCDRFRVPVVPALCVLAAAAVQVVWHQVKEKKRILKSAVVFLTAGFLVNSSLYPITRTNPAQDLLRLGMVALANGDYAKARTYAEQSSRLQPDLPNVHLTLGIAEWLGGNRERARQDLREELGNNPQSYAAMIDLARLYIEERKTDSAIALGMQTVQERPGVPAGYTCAAVGLQLRNDIQAAESLLHAGEKICGPDFLYGKYLLGGMEMEKGHIGEAEYRFRSVLRDLPLARQPGYDIEYGFSEESKMGITTSDLQSKVFNSMGRIFVSRGRMDSATVCFRNAARFDSTNADAWSNLGLALMQGNQFAGAESALKMATGLNTKNYLYWYNLGILYGNTGRLQDAKKSFEMVLQLRPDYAPAKERLALTLRLM